MIHDLSSSVAALRHQQRVSTSTSRRSRLVLAPSENSSAPPVVSESEKDLPERPTSPSSDELSDGLCVRKGKRSSETTRINFSRTWGPEMLSKVPWMAKFISGPRDPVANPYSVYCHVCQIVISTKSRGHHDVVRHWRRERHFRKEQRYRDSHGMEVLDRDCTPLTGHRLEKERRLFEDYPEFELGARYPFYSASCETPPSPADIPSLRTKVQLQCLADIISNGDQISAFRSVWGVVVSNFPTNEVVSEIDFSKPRIVCLIQFLFNSLVKILRELLHTEECYGLVFEDTVEERRLHLSVWRNNVPITILLLSCDRLSGGEHLDLLLLSRLFSALPQMSSPVSCIGTRLDVLKTIDRYYRPRTEILAHSPISSKLFERLLTSPTNLVFGRIDVFSVVEHIMMRLRGALTENWLLRSATLCRVSVHFFSFYCYVSSYVRLGTS